MRYSSKTMPDNVRRLLPQDAKRAMGVAGLTMLELIEGEKIRNESSFQKQVASYLRLKGIPFYSSWFGKRSTNRAGQPDFLCVVPPHGRTLGLECKFGTGNPTEEQMAELRKIQDAGGVGVVVWSLDAVRSVLSDMMRV